MEILTAGVVMIPLALFSVLALWRRWPPLFMLLFGYSWMVGLNAPDLISGHYETTTLGIAVGLSLIIYGMFCAMMAYRYMFWVDGG